MKNLKTLFLWIITIIGLILFLVGSVRLLNLGLKQYVFTKSDYPCYESIPAQADKGGNFIDSKRLCEEQRTSEKQREAANSLAYLIVGMPIFLTFYKLARKSSYETI